MRDALTVVALLAIVAIGAISAPPPAPCAGTLDPILRQGC